MGAGLELVDLECQAVEKRSIARPRFKNRTRGTLRVSSTKSVEKAYLLGPIAHPPRYLVGV